jgi:hypothetical protein
MCEVCAIFALGEHWTDAGHRVDDAFPARDIQRYRRERRYRVALANRVLTGSGVSCTDWDGASFAVVDAQGRQQVVPSLAALWPAAAALAKRPLDPLDPAFLKVLAEG